MKGRSVIWLVASILGMVFILRSCTIHEYKGDWKDSYGMTWTFDSLGEGKVFQPHADDDMIYHGYYADGEMYDDPDESENRSLKFKYRFTQGKMVIKFDNEEPIDGEWSNFGMIGKKFIAKIHQNHNEMTVKAENLESNDFALQKVK